MGRIVAAEEAEQTVVVEEVGRIAAAVVEEVE